MEYRVPKVTGKVKEKILSGPTLARPDRLRRFYIKTCCSKDGMVAVLLQADVSEEEIKSEAQENTVRKCEFDKSLEGMPLLQRYIMILLVAKL